MGFFWKLLTMLINIFVKVNSKLQIIPIINNYQYALKQIKIIYMHIQNEVFIWPMWPEVKSLQQSLYNSLVSL